MRAAIGLVIVAHESVASEIDRTHAAEHPFAEDYRSVYVAGDPNATEIECLRANLQTLSDDLARKLVADVSVRSSELSKLLAELLERAADLSEAATTLSEASAELSEATEKLSEAAEELSEATEQLFPASIIVSAPIDAGPHAPAIESNRASAAANSRRS